MNYTSLKYLKYFDFFLIILDSIKIKYRVENKFFLFFEIEFWVWSRDLGS